MTRMIGWEKFELIDEEEEHYFDLEEVGEEGEVENKLVKIEPIMVRTPLGTFSPFEPMCPTKMFECWVMHTNFDITESDLNKLKMINGIEVLKIMSRYRCFIGIGKMFEFKDVRENIQNILNINNQSENVGDSIMSKLCIAFDQMKDSKGWAIFLGNDGKILSISKELSENYDTDLNNLMTMKDGNIFIYAEK